METRTPGYKYGPLFAGEPVSEAEKTRVLGEIEKVGSLTFSITRTEDGWVAQCNEMPSIIAGDTNSNPSDEEITTEIRAAIFAGFDVKTEPKNLVESPYQEFKYAIIEG